MVMVLICIFISGCGTSNDRTSTKHEYEIISVYQYMKPVTGLFGSIRCYESKYYFSYIDEFGKLQEFDDFEHMECGL